MIHFLFRFLLQLCPASRIHSSSSSLDRHRHIASALSILHSILFRTPPRNCAYVRVGRLRSLIAQHVRPPSDSIPPSSHDRVILPVFAAEPYTLIIGLLSVPPSLPYRHHYIAVYISISIILGTYHDSHNLRCYQLDLARDNESKTLGFLARDRSASLRGLCGLWLVYPLCAPPDATGGR